MALTRAVPVVLHCRLLPVPHCAWLLTALLVTQAPSQQLPWAPQRLQGWLAAVLWQQQQQAADAACFHGLSIQQLLGSVAAAAGAHASKAASSGSSGSSGGSSQEAGAGTRHSASCSPTSAQDAGWASSGPAAGMAMLWQGAVTPEGTPTHRQAAPGRTAAAAVRHLYVHHAEPAAPGSSPMHIINSPSVGAGPLLQAGGGRTRCKRCAPAGHALQQQRVHATGDAQGMAAALVQPGAPGVAAAAGPLSAGAAGGQHRDASPAGGICGGGGRGDRAAAHSPAV